MIRPVLVPQWRRLQESPFAPPAALFVLAACISSVFAAEHHLAFRALYQVVLEPVLFFALLTLFVQRETEWWILVLCTIGSGLVVSCVGIGQLLTGHGVSLVPRSSVHRVKAFYGSPDNLGLLLDRVIPLWLAPLLFCFGKNGARVVWLLAGVPLIAALIYTFSRGAWFALAAVLLVYLVARGGRWTWVAAGILVLGLVGTGLKAHSAARLLQAGHAGTAQKRIDIWHSSLNMIRDHPIVGIGPDNFQHYYAPRPHQQLYSPDCPRGLGYLNDSSLTVSQEPCLSHPHDEFLDAWLSTGILGLVAFVWLQFAFWRLARSWSAAKETTRRVLLLGAAGAMLAGLLHGLVDNGYFLMDLSVLFWMVCALIQFCAESPRKRVAEP